MAQFKLKESKNQLTSYAGLSLIGQCLEAASVEAVLDGRIPVSQGMRTSDVAKAVVGLLSLGKSDFEAIEAFREDRFFKKALGMGKVPGSVWLRQRLDRVGGAMLELVDDLSVRLLERTQAPITAHKGYVCLDLDTFVMDQSGTKKEEVSRTYRGVDGYTPLAAYLGNEGWCVGLELRPGRWHSSLEADYFLERVFPRVERLVSAEEAPVLLRMDSGFDSARLLFAVAEEKARWAGLGRGFESLIKWNPRKQDKAAWVAEAEEKGRFVEVRPGKREALFSLTVERAWQKEKKSFRLVVRVIERSIDQRGQVLLIPDVQLEGWWTSLEDAEATVIERYRDHGTHEQFHSEFKTDLDLERLPSGKFETNDCLLRLAMFAYNSLRLIGQLGLTGDLAPLRHPAKRRRLRTVLQEIMYRAAQVIHKARQWWLDFGQSSPVAPVFAYLQKRLVAQPGWASG
jgi:hypothetical protein